MLIGMLSPRSYGPLPVDALVKVIGGHVAAVPLIGFQSRGVQGCVHLSHSGLNTTV